MHDHWKTTALTRWTFVGKVMSLLLNMLSRLVTAFHTTSVSRNHCCCFLLLYWFLRAAVKRGHKLGALKEQKFILSQFWLEVQNPGVSRVGSFRKF